MNDSISKIQPWKRIAFDPFFGGAWVVAGDVDGDGEVEIVTARNVDANDVHYTCTVAAYKLNGEQLWFWGGPGAGRAELHHDVACQLHDWNGDGRLEVVVAESRQLVVIDGATGGELRRLDLPNPWAGLSDCLTFCDLRGVGRRTDVLVKSRYTQIYALDQDGNVLWLSDHPGGCRTAHQPSVCDLDHDGRDEVLAGAVLLNPDGTERWRIGLPEEVLKKGHLDCCRLLRDAARPEDQRLAFTYCGSFLLGVMDGTGKVLWTKEGEHFESIDIARVIPGEPESQIIVDIDKAGVGKSPLVVFSQDGRELSRFHTQGSRSHRPVRWRAGDVSDIAVAGAGMIYSGTGEPIAELAMTKLSDQRGAIQTRDLTGDGYEDLLLSTRYGTAAYLYRNPRECQPRNDLPLGSEMNYTLY
jgi:hypothetical protein